MKESKSLSSDSLTHCTKSVNHECSATSEGSSWDKDEDNQAIIPTENSVSYGTVLGGTKTAIYPSRWYILLILCGGTMIENVIWGTWGPISDSAEYVYGWNTTYIFILTNCGNAGNLLPLIFTAYIVQRKGLRVSMLLCTFALALGSGLRVITMKTPAASILAAIGQFLGGFAGCILSAVPSQVSEAWFPLNERTTATTIAVVSNALGGTMIFLLGPNIVSQPRHTGSNNTINTTITSLGIDQTNVFAISAALFLSTLVYYPSKPEHPPSISAAEGRIDFKEGVIKLIRQPTMWQILLACTLPCGVYGNWLALSYIVFKHIGITQSEAGWYGFSACVGGVVGGLIIGRIANSFQQRMKLFLLVLFGAIILILIWIACIRNEYIPSSSAFVGVALTILGVLTNGALALSYEVACETGYPIHEGIIGTLLTLVINASSVAFLLVQLIPNIGTEWMTWTLLGTFIFGFILLATLKEKYKRFEIDILHSRNSAIEH